VAKRRKDNRSRKVRTREHRIASESEAHVAGIVVGQGFSVERVQNDYGYDLLMVTYTPSGEIEPGVVYLQLKATDSVKVTVEGIAFRIGIKDYRLWMHEPMPVFLIVFDAKAKVAYWLYVQNYFESAPLRKPGRTARSVQVVIPVAKVVDPAFVRYARGRKADVLKQLAGKVVHNG
jgi:hypothetical protein